MLLRSQQPQTRNTVKHTTMHKTAPTTKSYLAPGLNRAEAKEAGVVTLLPQAAAGTVGTGIEVSTCYLEAAVPWEDALGKATCDNGRTFG